MVPATVTDVLYLNQGRNRYHPLRVVQYSMHDVGDRKTDGSVGVPFQTSHRGTSAKRKRRSVLSSLLPRRCCFARARYLSNGNVANENSQPDHFLRDLEPALLIRLQPDVRQNVAKLHAPDVHSGPECN